jgi:NADPH-dependent ferric siderophore reductase
VRRAEWLGSRMARVSLGGPELAGLTIDEPAASIRLLIPGDPGERLVMPDWNGNEFLLPDGTRPIIRTFTPSLVGPDELDLDLDVVLHGGGAVARWAGAARPGDEAAVSGPGRGFTVDSQAGAYLLLGDETAIPAISQLLDAMPTGVPVEAHIEVVDADALVALPARDLVTVHWHEQLPGAPPCSTLVDVLVAIDLQEGTRVWAAGEAAAMHRMRGNLFDERSMPRSEATVRGYWKVARAESA